MSSFNSITLMGNLTKDPIYRESSNGGGVCTLRLAVNTYRKDDDEEVLFIDAVVFGKQAVSCEKYLSKGRGVLVSGRLKNRTYDDKEGVTKYVTEVIANTVQFLGSSNGNDEALAVTTTEASGQEKETETVAF
mgnify:FL=1